MRRGVRCCAAAANGHAAVEEATNPRKSLRRMRPSQPAVHAIGIWQAEADRFPAIQPPAIYPRFTRGRSHNFPRTDVTSRDWAGSLPLESEGARLFQRMPRKPK